MTINKHKKYNSVAAREWPNNIYSFNRNNEKLSSYKKDAINKIIKNYFNLTKKEKSFKGKRMKDLIKRSTLLRLFNSKGIVKQNNDKINVSIHTFNKRRSKMARNLFSFNRYLNKFNKYNVLTSVRALRSVNMYNNTNLLKKTQIINSNLILQTYKINLINYIKTSSIIPLRLTKNNNLKYYNIYMKNMNFSKKHNNLVSLTSNTKLSKSNAQSVSIENKKLFHKKKKIMLQKKKGSLYKKLIKTLPWSFERKKIILYKIVSLRAFYYSILKSMGISLHTSFNRNSFIINMKPFNTSEISYIHNNKNLTIKLPAKFNIINTKIYNKSNNAFNIKNKKKMLKKITNLKFERYIHVNNILKKIINQIIKITALNNNNSKNNDIILLKKNLYNEFKKNNIQRLFLRFFGKQYLILNNIYRLYIDNEKHTGITNNLKYILNKIYNKKVSLNITELKYLHLNADMLSNAVVIKLTNMKSKLSQVLRKTLKLAKLGKPKSDLLSKSNNLYTKNKTNITFGNLIDEMYDPTEMLKKDNNLNVKNKTKEVIKNLKHKWTTGVRLEGKGRLTARYASGRALYKYRAKGNLKSKLKYTNQNFILNEMSSSLPYANEKVTKKNPYVPLFRGILIPNIQYVKKNGFKRIGAFGVKLWINNNS